jgi:hypothetical protein
MVFSKYVEFINVSPRGDLCRVCPVPQSHTLFSETLSSTVVTLWPSCIYFPRVGKIVNKISVFLWISICLGCNKHSKDIILLERIFNWCMLKKICLFVSGCTILIFLIEDHLQWFSLRALVRSPLMPFIHVKYKKLSTKYYILDIYLKLHFLYYPKQWLCYLP